MLTVLITLALCIPSGQALQQSPVHYRVLNASLRADVRQALDGWESVSLRFVEDERTKSFFDIEETDESWAGLTSAKEGEFRIWINSNAYPPARVAILQHEIGHAIGLEHTSCQDSIMTTSPAGWGLDKLAAGDMAARDRLYPMTRIYVPTLWRAGVLY